MEPNPNRSIDLEKYPIVFITTHGNYQMNKPSSPSEVEEIVKCKINNGMIGYYLETAAFGVPNYQDSNSENVDEMGQYLQNYLNPRDSRNITTLFSQLETEINNKNKEIGIEQLNNDVSSELNQLYFQKISYDKMVKKQILTGDFPISAKRFVRNFSDLDDLSNYQNSNYDMRVNLITTTGVQDIYDIVLEEKNSIYRRRFNNTNVQFVSITLCDIMDYLYHYNRINNVIIVDLSCSLLFFVSDDRKVPVMKDLTNKKKLDSFKRQMRVLERDSIRQQHRFYSIGGKKLFYKKIRRTRKTRKNKKQRSVKRSKK